jgi:hypothetical protein
MAACRQLLAYALLAFLLWNTEGAAQTFDLRGVVIDSTTGERLPFATVTIPAIKKGASTNAEGFYLITDVPYGHIEVVVTSVGYERKAKAFAVQSMQQVTLNVQLIPRPVEVSEVVSEAPMGAIVSEALASVHIMQPTDFQAVPIAGQDDVLRALQILPGVVSAADVSAKLYVRGGSGDQNLIMLDGMKIYNPYHALGIYSIFDPDIIKSTEVYTGAFPAGYGGRLSSVVNVRTRTGNATRIAGNIVLDPLASRLQLEGPIGSDNTWIVSGRKSLFNEPYRKLLRNSVPVSFYDVFAKATHWSSELGRISVEGFLSGDDISPAQAGEAGYSWRNKAFNLSVSELIGDRIYANANIYANSFSVNQEGNQGGTVLPAASKVEDLGVRGELSIYTSSRTLFLGGFNVGSSSFDNRITTRQKTQTASSTVSPEALLWFRAQVPLEVVTVDAGLEADGVSLIRHGAGLYDLQPRINLSYAFDNNWRAKLAYGVMSQHVVTITNEDDITSLFEAWIAIPEELTPEEAHHYVAGIEGNILPALSTNLQGYYKSYRSLLFYNRDKALPGDPDFVQGTGSAYGVEALARFSSPLIDLYCAYSLSHTTVTVSGLTYAPRYDRQHSVSALAVFHPIERLDVAFRWEYGSGFPFSQTLGFYDRLSLDDISGEPFLTQTGEAYPLLGAKNAARLPPYHRLDAGLTYNVMFWSVRGVIGLHVMNVFDRHNILTFDRVTRTRIDMVPFYPSIMMKLEF